MNARVVKNIVGDERIGNETELVEAARIACISAGDKKLCNGEK